jgi:hypothetical protein
MSSGTNIIRITINPATIMSSHLLFCFILALSGFNVSVSVNHTSLVGIFIWKHGIIHKLYVIVRILLCTNSNPIINTPYTTMLQCNNVNILISFVIFCRSLFILLSFLPFAILLSVLWFTYSDYLPLIYVFWLPPFDLRVLITSLWYHQTLLIAMYVYYSLWWSFVTCWFLYISNFSMLTLLHWSIVVYYEYPHKWCMVDRHRNIETWQSQYEAKQ